MTGLRRALLTMAAVAFVAGLITIPVELASNHVAPRGLAIAQQLLIGWSFIATGLFMWWREPENRIGVLMTGVGFTWLLGVLYASNDGYVFFFGEIFGALAYGFLVQMLLSFPDGHLHSRLERVVVAATWFTVTIMQWVPLPFFQFWRQKSCAGCPSNPWLITDNPTAADWLIGAQTVLAIVIAVGLVIAVVRRLRAMAPMQRREHRLVIWTGVVALLVLLVALATRFGGSKQPIWLIGLLPLAAVPYAFIAGLMQSRFSRAGAVSELVARLNAAPGDRQGIGHVLADAFHDPSLILAYWLPERGEYVDVDGHPCGIAGAGRCTGLDTGRARWSPGRRDHPRREPVRGAAAARGCGRGGWTRDRERALARRAARTRRGTRAIPSAAD